MTTKAELFRQAKACESVECESEDLTDALRSASRTLRALAEAEAEFEAEPTAQLPYAELAAFMDDEAHGYDLIGGAFIPHPVSKNARRKQIADILRSLAEAEVAAARPRWGVYDLARNTWWPRSFASEAEAQDHYDRCKGPDSRGEARVRSSNPAGGEGGKRG